MFYGFQCISLFPPHEFIPKYFVLFNVIVNRIISLISFSDCLLLVYRNTTDFYLLFFYPVTCWIWLLVLTVCVCVFERERERDLWLYTYKNMSSVNIDNLTPSFPNWMPPPPKRIVLSRTSDMMLNRSGEGTHFCFIPELRGQDLSFSVSCSLFMYGLNYVELFSSI